MRSNRLSLSGTSILEIIITSALIAIGLTGLLALSTKSQQTSDFSKNNNLASNYSYQVIDWLRNIRQTLGYDTLIYYLSQESTNPVIYCLNSSLPNTETEFANLTSTPCDNTTHLNNIFSRQLSIDMSYINSNYIECSVTTSWQGNKLYTNTQSIKLTQWE